MKSEEKSGMIKCEHVSVAYHDCTLANAEHEVLRRSAGISCRVDDSGVAIGRRYARMDELGVPFAVYPRPYT